MALNDPKIPSQKNSASGFLGQNLVKDSQIGPKVMIEKVAQEVK